MKKQIILALMLASAGIGLQAQTYTTLGIGTADPVGTLHTAHCSLYRRAACVPRLPALNSHPAGGPPAYQDCLLSVLIPQAGRLRSH